MPRLTDHPDLSATTALTGPGAAAGLAPFLGLPAAGAPAVRPRAEDGGDDDPGLAQDRDGEQPPEEEPESGDEGATGKPGKNGKHGKNGRHAEPDGDEGDGEDGEGDGEDEEPDGDEEEDERMSSASAERNPKLRARAIARLAKTIRAHARANARAAERKRIGAILRHPSAVKNPGLATHLAFATDRSARDSRAELDAAASASAQGSGLEARMEAYGYRPGPTSRNAPNRQNAQQALDASWDAAAKEAGIP